MEPSSFLFPTAWARQRWLYVTQPTPSREGSAATVAWIHRREDLTSHQRCHHVTYLGCYKRVGPWDTQFSRS